MPDEISICREGTTDLIAEVKLKANTDRLQDRLITEMSSRNA